MADQPSRAPLVKRVYRRLFPEPLPEHFAKACLWGQGEEYFDCNICGTRLRLARKYITRESGHCPRCHSYSRLRAIIHALQDELPNAARSLKGSRPDPNIKILGCSDAENYAQYLMNVGNYLNTFYDRAPELDLLKVDAERYPNKSFDFITCSDVMEHVPPPLDKAFAHLHDLLKPGGVLILSVPTKEHALETREHFPDLHDWKLVDLPANGKRKMALINRLPDGREQRFEDLCFHGGEGLTLEMRVFSRPGLIHSLKQAGFEIRKIYDCPVWERGIALDEFNFVVAAGRA